ncbi:hypothetical protein D1872_38530 [compost metagenome]
MSERIYISLADPVDNTKDLISEIKTLVPEIPRKVQPKREVIEEAPEPFILSSSKKKDKKNKKKKRKTETDLLMEKLLSINASEELNESQPEYLYDIIERAEEDETDDDLSDEIIEEGKRNYDKMKKEEDQFNKDFAEPMGLLYDLLDDVSKFSKDLDKTYKSMENSKVRGTSKYKNDLIMSMLNAKSTRLSVIKEIGSMKKTIIDLGLKAKDKNKDSDAAQSNDILVSKYMQSVLGDVGRSNFVQSIGAGGGYNPAMDMSSVSHNHDTSAYDDETDDAIEERLAQLGGNQYRSDEGNLQIMYESMGVTVNIRRYIDSGEYEFYAVDKQGNEIVGYPLPSEDMVGRIKFSSDYRSASDKYGRIYRVNEI